MNPQICLHCGKPTYDLYRLPNGTKIPLCAHHWSAAVRPVGKRLVKQEPEK